jgi:hypothetical protein
MERSIKACSPQFGSCPIAYQVVAIFGDDPDSAERLVAVAPDDDRIAASAVSPAVRDDR